MSEEMIIKDFDLQDVFLMSEIIEKMDIEVDIEKYMGSSDMASIFASDEGKTAEQVGEEAETLGKTLFLKAGLDLAIVFVKRMHRAQKEVRKLIANLTGMTMEETLRMSLKDIKKFFSELVEKEGFKDFFSQAEE